MQCFDKERRFRHEKFSWPCLIIVLPHLMLTKIVFLENKFLAEQFCDLSNSEHSKKVFIFGLFFTLSWKANDDSGSLAVNNRSRTVLHFLICMGQNPVISKGLIDS